MTRKAHRSGARMRRTALAGVAAGALVAGIPASMAAAHDGGHYSKRDSVRTVVDGLNGPRGLAADDGKVVVTESDGSFSLIWTRHRHRHDGEDSHQRRGWGDQTKIVKLGQVPGGFSPAVDIGRHGTLWLLTGGGAPNTGAATLYKWRWGDTAPTAFADIGAYQATDPDPYDLENHPTDSNPFGLAALKDGSVLVTDAGGNDLLRVSKWGTITTVARLMPRTVPVPTGLPATLPGEDGGPPITLPPAGTPIPAEAVATSVTVGDDGHWYVGELRGFPGTPGTSEIWRIHPGTTNAVCDPAHPDTGSCKRYADGLTSIMDLAAGDDDEIYAVEMSKMSWLQAELQLPGAEVGALIKVSDWGDKMRELAAGKLILPGGVATDHGRVYVAGPVFGPGSVVQVGRR